MLHCYSSQKMQYFEKLFVTILLSKHYQNYKLTEISFKFHNIDHICWSRGGLVPSPQVIKARDRVQDRVIDIRVQDQDRAKSVSRPASRPPTLPLTYLLRFLLSCENKVFKNILFLQDNRNHY